MKKNNVNNATQKTNPQNNCNTIITLRQLKATLPSTKGKKLPGYTQLRQTGQPVVSVETLGCRMEVYDNGFAVYQNGSHSTVLRMEHVGLAEFDSVTEDKSHHEPMDDAEWCVAVMMNGEDRIEKMYKANVEPNMVSTTDAVENEDGETSDMEFDAGVDVEGQIMDKLVNENAEMVERLMSALTEKQRKIAEMYYLKNMTQQQIADELGVTQPNVTITLGRANENMKKFLRKI